MKDVNLEYFAAPLDFPHRGKSRSEKLLARPSFHSGHRGRSNFLRAAQIQSLRLIFLWLIILPLLMVVGCELRRDMEEVKREVLEFDPSFKDTLAKKEELDSQIGLVMDEFRQERSEINSKIMELKEELRGIRRQAYSRARELKSQLDPERQEIASRLNELRASLRSKKRLLSTLKGSIKKTQKFVEQSKESGVSRAEEAKWQENLDDLNSQLPSLQEEIAKLRREIYLYRQKLNLLKQ